MRYSQSEKMEIIRLVENSEISAKRTLMELGIKVIAEDLKTNETRHCNSCYFTMVAMNEKEKPVEVSKLIPVTEDQIRRYADAAKRRDKRIDN